MRPLPPQHPSFGHFAGVQAPHTPPDSPPRAAEAAVVAGPSATSTSFDNDNAALLTSLPPSVSDSSMGCEHEGERIESVAESASERDKERRPDPVVAKDAPVDLGARHDAFTMSANTGESRVKSVEREAATPPPPALTRTRQPETPGVILVSRLGAPIHTTAQISKRRGPSPSRQTSTSHAPSQPPPPPGRAQGSWRDRVGLNEQIAPRRGWVNPKLNSSESTVLAPGPAGNATDDGPLRAPPPPPTVEKTTPPLAKLPEFDSNGRPRPRSRSEPRPTRAADVDSSNPVLPPPPPAPPFPPPLPSAPPKVPSSAHSIYDPCFPKPRATRRLPDPAPPAPGPSRWHQRPENPPPPPPLPLLNARSQLSDAADWGRPDTPSAASTPGDGRVGQRGPSIPSAGDWYGTDVQSWLRSVQSAQAEEIVILKRPAEMVRTKSEEERRKAKAQGAAEGGGVVVPWDVPNVWRSRSPTPTEERPPTHEPPPAENDKSPSSPIVAPSTPTRSIAHLNDTAPTSSTKADPPADTAPPTSLDTPSELLAPVATTSHTGPPKSSPAKIVVSGGWKVSTGQETTPAPLPPPSQQPPSEPEKASAEPSNKVEPSAKDPPPSSSAQQYKSTKTHPGWKITTPSDAHEAPTENLAPAEPAEAASKPTKIVDDVVPPSREPTPPPVPVQPTIRPTLGLVVVGGSRGGWGVSLSPPAPPLSSSLAPPPQSPASSPIQPNAIEPLSNSELVKGDEPPANPTRWADDAPDPPRSPSPTPPPSPPLPPTRPSRPPLESEPIQISASGGWHTSPRLPQLVAIAEVEETPTPPPDAPQPQLESSSSASKHALNPLAKEWVWPVMTIEEAKVRAPDTMPLASGWQLSFAATTVPISKRKGFVRHPIFLARTVHELCEGFKAIWSHVACKRGEWDGEDQLLLGEMGMERWADGATAWFFREGVLPVYEDHRNVFGGKISLSLPRHALSRVFLDLALSLAGSTLDAELPTPQIVVGIVACRREKQDRLEVWLGARHQYGSVAHEWVRDVREWLKEESWRWGCEESVGHYVPHDPAIQVDVEAS